MRLPRFYIPPDHRDGDAIRLPEPVARQLRLVLRLTEGDQIEVFTGDGWGAIAIIERLAKTDAAARVIEPVTAQRELPQRLALVAAYLKGEKADWVVQKATELGADRIVWFPARRSVAVPPAARLDERLARWRRIAVEAAEQCGRLRVPEVNAAPAGAPALAEMPGRHLLLLYEAATVPLRTLLPPSPAPVAIVVGPEGGFTPEEAEQLIARGARSAGLGRRILRAETAALAGMALVGDWMEGARGFAGAGTGEH